MSNPVRFGSLHFEVPAYNPSRTSIKLFANGKNPVQDGLNSDVYLNGQKIGTSIAVLKASRRLNAGAQISQKELTALVKKLLPGGNELSTRAAATARPFYPQGESKYFSGLELFNKLNSQANGFNPFLNALEKNSFVKDGSPETGFNAVSFLPPAEKAPQFSTLPASSGIFPLSIRDLKSLVKEVPSTGADSRGIFPLTLDDVLKSPLYGTEDDK